MDNKNELEEQKYRGERYEAVVPDTLDLAERARLAVQGNARTYDPFCAAAGGEEGRTRFGLRTYRGCVDERERVMRHT